MHRNVILFNVSLNLIAQPIKRKVSEEIQGGVMWPYYLVDQIAGQKGAMDSQPVLFASSCCHLSVQVPAGYPHIAHIVGV